MSTADRDRWDARYAAGDAGEPAPPVALVGRERLLPATGRALDVVVGQRFRAPALYAAMVDVLAPGGLLVVTVLAGGDGPFRAAPGELLAAFGHLAVVHHEETGGEAHLVARRP